jgi:hypothetical protein
MTRIDETAPAAMWPANSSAARACSESATCSGAGLTLGVLAAAPGDCAPRMIIMSSS